MKDGYRSCPFCGCDTVTITPLEGIDERRFWQRKLSCDGCDVTFSAAIGWGSYNRMGAVFASDDVGAILRDSWNRRPEGNEQ